MSEPKEHKDRTLEEVSEHQVSHCAALLAIERDLEEWQGWTQGAILSVQTLLRVLLRKGVVNMAEIDAEVEALREAQSKQEEAYN